ncbi:MAG: phospholipase D-like domain-containing protein [Cytophagales bacterium]|nr:phospholipase D-like domain-containing protein [Cytophagales bacterium]MDW8383422.1 phospholipase D-like domain-containing protein [Flammeovirgaceae bacterium]
MKHLLILLSLLFSTFLASAQELITVAQARTVPLNTVVRLRGIALNGTFFDRIDRSYNAFRSRGFSDGTGAILIDDDFTINKTIVQEGEFKGFTTRRIVQSIHRGDSLEVIGKITVFRGMLQVQPVAGREAEFIRPIRDASGAKINVLKSLVDELTAKYPTWRTSTKAFNDMMKEFNERNPRKPPKLRNLDLAPEFEAYVVEIDSAFFTATYGRKRFIAPVGTPSDLDSTGDYRIGRSTGSCTQSNCVQMRLRDQSHDLIRTPTQIPSGRVAIRGIIRRVDNFYYICPMFKEDLEISLTFFQTTVTNISPYRMEINWETSQPADVVVSYNQLGKTNIVTLPVIKNNDIVGKANIEHLEAGALYEFNLMAVKDQDTAYTTAVFATESNSSGQIKVMFNRPVEAARAFPGNTAIFTNAIADTIAAYIDRANFTVDVAIYNLNTSDAACTDETSPCANGIPQAGTRTTRNGLGATAIINALMRAHDRGVRVRYITNFEANTGAFNQIVNANKFKAIRRPQDAENDGIMHHKFIVIDAESRLNSWVIGGSGNFTQCNLNVDANNFVFIQDQALARAYTVEFEEMWGSQTEIPNITNARFGARKLANTPTQYIVGGRKVELYFSPSDGTQDAIINKIYTVKNDIRFIANVFTQSVYSNALISVARSGGKGSYIVKGLINNDADVDIGGTNQFTYLRDTSDKDHDGFKNLLVFQSNKAYDLHHKYVIIDADVPSANTAVITGSHNWTNRANTFNDENTLIIYDAMIANQFAQEFARRYYETSCQQDVPLLKLEKTEEQDSTKTMRVFPNPAQYYIYVDFDFAPSFVQISLIDIYGHPINANIKQLSAQQYAISVEELPYGTYLLRAVADKEVFNNRILVVK